VVRDVGLWNPEQLRPELDLLEAAVRDRAIAAGSMRGATIGLSNFGTPGGRYAVMTIPPRQPAILGAGRIEIRAVVRDGRVDVGRELPLSLTFDHRAVTGGEAACFLGRHRGPGGRVVNQQHSLVSAEPSFRFSDPLGPRQITLLDRPTAGLRAIVVVDNTAAGPAIGGVRLASEVSLEECVRLARAMTLNRRSRWHTRRQIRCFSVIRDAKESKAADSFPPRDRASSTSRGDGH
jgi:hypothetical protein